MGEGEGWYSRGEGFLMLKVASESGSDGGGRIRAFGRACVSFCEFDTPFCNFCVLLLRF